MFQRKFVEESETRFMFLKLFLRSCGFRNK
jgi:hypothetical protein